MYMEKTGKGYSQSSVFSIYVINFIAVCFVSGVMALCVVECCGKDGSSRISTLGKTRPWKPEQIILVSVFGYRAFALFGSLSHGCDGEKEWLRPFCLGAEILACIVTAAGMNLAYKGLVLVMAADMILGRARRTAESVVWPGQL